LVAAAPFIDETLTPQRYGEAGNGRDNLMMTKMVVNQAYENMGLATTQMLATFLDGVARHTPQGIWFREHAQEVGFKQAVAERDSGEPIAPHASKR
jgi:enoyl-CoA hydratase